MGALPFRHVRSLALLALPIATRCLLCSRPSVIRSPLPVATAASESGVAIHRSVSFAFASGSYSHDVTHMLEAAVPALPNGVLHLFTGVSAGANLGIALMDPRILTLGNPAAVAPGACEQQQLSLCVHNGQILLPSHVRVLAVRSVSEGEATAQLSIRLEIADELARDPPRPSPRTDLARAALLACLAESGVSPADVCALQAAKNAGTASAASRVFESFVRAGGGQASLARAAAVSDGVPSSPTAPAAPTAPAVEHQAPADSFVAGEALLSDARRTAHHVAHLLRSERVQAATYVRNSDPSSDRAGEDDGVGLVPLRIVLDNVRSAYNVGSIFRTADAARLAEVITCGFTPHPPHPKLAKTGFAALEHVPTRHFESTAAAIAALRTEGVPLLAMETTERSENYVDVEFPSSGVALVLGNEEVGVDTDVLHQVDNIIEIPCLGYKNSLNIASACSVVVFEVLRQWGTLRSGNNVKLS